MLNLNPSRPARLSLSDELSIAYWRQVVRLMRWMRRQEPRLSYVRKFAWMVPLAWLVGLLVGLLSHLVL